MPSINLGQLTANAGGGALMQQFYSTLGTGARSSKIISLLGNIDGLSSRLGKLGIAGGANASG